MNRYIKTVALLAAFISNAGLSNTGLAHPPADTEVSAGQDLYAQCMGCHSPAYHRTGPKHCNLLGRRAGQAQAFEFTPAMRDSDIVWSKQTLDAFLKAPLENIPGTSMGFAGISSAKQRKQLIEFLASLTPENPLCQ